MSARRNSTSIAKMTISQLDAMVAEFDREFIADSFGPMDAKAKALHQRAKKKRGRPRLGAGSQVISVTIEKRLLRQVDQLARQLGISRAKLIAVGLFKMMKAGARSER